MKSIYERRADTCERIFIGLALAAAVGDFGFDIRVFYVLIAVLTYAASEWFATKGDVDD
ncbi:MAG: hypothetical protein ACFB00_05155 [Parvularculaceae bacterium]